MWDPARAFAEAGSGRCSCRGSRGANGQAGVENVLDIMRMGIDSALLGMGVASVRDLRPEHLIVPDGFHRALGVTAEAPPGSSAFAAPES